MNAQVVDLVPGDRVENAGMTAVFVARTEHPLYPYLQLVIWRLQDGTWSHDALDEREWIGRVLAGEDRAANLRASLLGARP